MKIVIQCAGEKKSNAGCLKTTDNRNILFVAQSYLSASNKDYVYKSPNDLTEKGTTWMDELINYNKQNNNYLNLLPAFELYKNSIYRDLVKKYGAENIFILSAGWGLIRADFLTPKYNITFSNSKNVNIEFKRNKKDIYNDLCLIPLDLTDDLIFLGGIDYQHLFNKLTTNYKGKRIVFYNSINYPNLKNCEIIKFNTTQKTNWHYTCAKKLIAGDIKI